MYTYIHHRIPRHRHGSNPEPQRAAPWPTDEDVDDDKEHFDDTRALPHCGRDVDDHDNEDDEVEDEDKRTFLTLLILCSARLSFIKACHFMCANLQPWYGWINGCMDGCMDGWWMDGLMDE